MNNQIKSADFFKAGNAIFTVSNPQGDHYTFKIRKKDEESPYFVSLLSGPDNTSDYTYLGLYIPDSYDPPHIKLTRKSKFSDQTTPVKVIRWAINMVLHSTPVPAGYAIQHEGKCCRCGRRLTTPESVDAGIGPECGNRR